MIWKVPAYNSLAISRTFCFANRCILFQFMASIISCANCVIVTITVPGYRLHFHPSLHQGGPCASLHELFNHWARYTYLILSSLNTSSVSIPIQPPAIQLIAETSSSLDITIKKSNMASKLSPSMELSSQIKRAIAVWRTSSAKPPFSVEQLVAMAILSQGHPMNPTDIFHWINGTFSWYADIVSRAYLEKPPDYRHPEGLPKMVDDLRVEIASTLTSYEFTSYIDLSDTNTPTWSVKIPAVLELLRLILEPNIAPTTSRVGFFKLPAELRNQVYDMVFQYPLEPGLLFFEYPRRGLTRFEFNVGRKDGLIKNTSPIAKILEPLLTFRQFFKEAQPTFYRINHFKVHDLEALQNRLIRLAPERRKHLSHVSFAYPRRDRVKAETAFQLLAKVEHLRILNIRIEETAWLRWARSDAERKANKAGKDPQEAREQYQSALDMPGMDILRSMRGLEEVNITGFRKDTVQQRTINTLKAELTREKRPMKRRLELVDVPSDDDEDLLSDTFANVMGSQTKRARRG